MEIILYILIAILILEAIAIAFYAYINRGKNKLIAELLEANNEYDDWIVKIKIKLKDSYENMTEIDKLGAFEADDEVGETFKTIYEIIEELYLSSEDNFMEKTDKTIDEILEEDE